MVVPIFINFSIVLERVKSHKKRNIIMSILWGISILFCMSFPVNLGQNVRLDLRIVPLILGSLYGGFWSSIFLSALIIAYRLYSGFGIGFYNTVLVLLLSIPVILIFQKYFARAEKRKRVKIAVGLSLYYCFIGFIIFIILRGFSIEYAGVQIIQLIFGAIATWFFIMLYETLIEINHIRTELQNAEKLKVISELTSVFAHEIRNPMQVARGFLQLLDEPDLPNGKKEYIQISLEELDRANEIINDFLAFGKPVINNNERMEVGYQLQRVAKILQSYSLNHNVQIKTDIVEDCWIFANGQKFNQSLINIVKNAIESMPNGGMVWITCTPTNDGFINISIKDQGIGMTKEQMDRLGYPFYSLKESGTGLGMMVSYQIIRSFKGKIKVKSEKDKGTEFIILFPKIN
ncbi:ATP-binding protein [Niallia sp. FSL W8-0635]|uniref:ATP-binding protein n=1 Tax=Niallia sp. FSL W8-0635 TaxID=2975337 RepID=UPI0030FCD643